MTRSLERDPTTGDLWIRFGFDAQLLTVVRSLPGRRWQPSTRRWVVPAQFLTEAAARLLPLGFHASDAVNECLERSRPGGVTSDGAPNERVTARPLVRPSDASSSGASPAPARPEDAGPLFSTSGPAPRPIDAPSESPTLSVSELNQRVRSVLAASFSRSLWVTGEVVGFDRNAHKRHLYFQIAEKAEGDDRPVAVVNAVLFEGKRQEIFGRLQRSDPPLELRDGVRIRVRVGVDLFVPRGSYQVIIEDIDPEFTHGDIARRRERILAELGRRGIADRNRALELPVLPFRVGLITSRESDAYNDFVHELARSGFAFVVSVHDSHVQGDRLESDVLRALDWFRARADQFDVLAIVRGGGARTELMAFDSLPLGVAVATHPLKILVGIGHQRDAGVLDAIAHSEKTPTAVAQCLVASAEREVRRLDEAVRRLPAAAAATLSRLGDRFDQVTRRFARGLESRLERAHRQIDQTADRLSHGARRAIAFHGARLERSEAILPRVATATIAAERARLDAAVRRVVPRALARLERDADRLDAVRVRVESCDPRRRWAQGYVWLRDPDGALIRSVEQAPEGTEVSVELPDGSLELEVRRRHRRSGPADLA